MMHDLKNIDNPSTIASGCQNIVIELADYIKNDFCDFSVICLGRTPVSA